MRNVLRSPLVVALVVLLLGRAAAQAPVEPLRFASGAVVSQSLLASETGRDVLARGGNAVDAAVAAALALAVTHPAAGNIGGGGFLVALLPDGRATTFDFRERAPARAHAEMFLDASGEYDASRHHEGHLSVGVPGSVAGLALAHARLGSIPWRWLLEPAIALARDGFPVSAGLAADIASERDRFRLHAATLSQFTRADGSPLRAGDVLRQPDLARTLERLRDFGPEEFYRGETARLIASEMERGGGWITLDDLADYRAVERPPIRGTYRDFDIVSMPPPSSGGIALVSMLNVLEGFDIRGAGFRSALETHWIVESMRRAFADRARYLGDTDHVVVPALRLTSKEYAARRRGEIDSGRASRSAPTRFEWPAESEETTHLSVVDARRMAVSLTTTLEYSYGSAIVVTGAGFLLNNEMGDFNARPGLTTEGGLIGSPPNLAAPGKRMLSSMTPTIVAKEGRPVLVLGSPGGRTIINSVLEVIVGSIDHGLPVQAAVDAPRFHHQWLPDGIIHEARAFSPDTAALLRARGHELTERDGPQGSVMAIAVTDRGELEVGCDRRRYDAGAAGH